MHCIESHQKYIIVRKKSSASTMMRPCDPEEDSEPGAASSNYTEICIVGRDLTEFSVIRFGSFITRIDLSFNLLTKVKGLEVCSETLEELILDNNQLETVEFRTAFPKLHTVSLNKNRIWDLSKILKDLSTKAMGLRYLSLLGNPVCPDQLSDDFVSEADYQVFRCHILWHLPSLKFLDHRLVSARELKQAEKVSYASVKISPAFTPLPSTASTFTGGASSPSSSELSSSPAAGRESQAQSKNIRTGKQGRRRFKYVGKNSEGNRFIKDSDL